MNKRKIAGVVYLLAAICAAAAAVHRLVDGSLIMGLVWLALLPYLIKNAVQDLKKHEEE